MNIGQEVLYRKRKRIIQGYATLDGKIYLIVLVSETERYGLPIVKDELKKVEL